MDQARNDSFVIRRNTRQKTLVKECVKQHFDHPTADSIYLSAREKDEKISKGTVYRNLKELSERGEILHIKVPGADRYDSRTDLHYHIMCVFCSCVVDVPVEYEGRLDEEASRATGFECFRHRTLFEGICPGCRSKGLK